jgi:hypothetical protein
MALEAGMDSHLQRLYNAITSATCDLTIEQLERHPEGKWSTTQILEHLHLTYTGTVKGMQLCLDGGKPRARRRTLAEFFKVFLVTQAGYFPEGRSAPERTRPRGMAAKDICEQIAGNISAMDQIIAKCERRFGKRTLVLDHPILGPLTCTQWRKFHWVHGRHHVKQILRLREGG